MRTVLLAGLRAHASRLVATACAVVLSVAFLVGTLALSATFVRTTEQSLTANMTRADVWVGAADEAAPVDGDVLEAVLPSVRAAAHVAAADAERTAFGAVLVGDTRTTVQVSTLLDASVRWQELAGGTWPAGPTETTIDAWAAGSLGLEVGDLVTFRLYRSAPVVLTVVGITTTTGPGVVVDMPRLVVTGDGLAAAGARPPASEILVRGDGEPPAVVAAGVAASLDGVPGIVVLTREQATERRVAQLSGSATVLTGSLLGFCVVALVVAAIVIANTFHVLVAQRTHELALLRCIGAGKRQVHRLVLGEAVALGTVASGVGVGLGLLGAEVLARWRMTADGIVATPAAPAVGFVVGVALTVVAASPAARQATRALPVEALRPIEAVAEGTPRRWLRTAVALLLLAAGVAGATVAAEDGGIVVAIPAVVVSFLGVLVVAPLVVPGCVRGLGAVVSGTSVAARLAARNAARNRRRTTATATALLVGVTLVTTMVVATASVRSSVDAEIDASRPIDLVVTTSDPAGLAVATRRAVDALPEVVGTTEVTGGVRVKVTLADGGTRSLLARGVDPAAAQRLARAPVAQPGEGTVLVHRDAAGLAAGDTVQVVGADGSAAVVVDVTPDTVPGTVTMRADELAVLVAAAPVVELQVRLASDLTGAQVQQAISSVLSIDDRVAVSGGAPERAMYTQLFDLMLLGVLALLTLSLVIAVVGVANTMALSVVERRRESAVLRALGLTVRQLRGMLAVEAGLVAAVAAVLGVGLGTAYAWVGVMALGVEATRVPMHMVVPVGSLGQILGAAVLAGVLASLMPGRRAARVSPAEALTID
ncbi:FtsX-like permease family protein [Cellulomonas sp. S1-8]|uniref:FtsX-like permease family protein n=1 Tax=Cellulomonas sp. S1-8 TaxID=2904790 RepID=UPI002244CBAB|nr:ABC transporter permease [Cellulomonas sp. S1-8]UZN02602.1 ABC transporter permease [Cellulomonas sp. S1-8]